MTIQTANKDGLKQNIKKKENETFICLQNVSNKTDRLKIICEIPVFTIRV